MEIDRKNAVKTTLHAKHARAASLDTRELKSHNSHSMSSANTDSSISNASVHSTTSSSVYCSPEKKKHRSHRKEEAKPQSTFDDDENFFNESKDCHSQAAYMDVCANLDDAFSHQQNSQCSPEVKPMPNPTSARPTRFSTTLPNSMAPLDPQYKTPTDLDGADSF
jgi:hypothetical protein